MTGNCTARFAHFGDVIVFNIVGLRTMSYVISDVVMIISSTGNKFGTSTDDVSYHTNTTVAEHQSISGTTVCDSAMDRIESCALVTAVGLAGQGDHRNGQSG